MRKLILSFYFPISSPIDINASVGAYIILKIGG